MQYPFYHQLDARDCVPTCLRMVSKYYGKEFSQQYLRDKCFSQKTGTSLLSLIDGATNIGLKATGVKITYEKLFDLQPYPCFVQWNKQHLVVLYKIEGDKVVIGDPAAGILSYDIETFKKCWLASTNVKNVEAGIVILVKPSEGFHRHEENSDYHKEYRFRNLLRYLSPHKFTLFKLTASILLGSLLSLIFPFLTQIIVDEGIANKSINTVVIILACQFSIMIGIAITNYLSNWCILHVSTRIGVKLIDDFLTKLMVLPIKFYDKKTVGDLLQRIGDFTRIEFFLTTSLVSIVITLITFMVYSSILLGYAKILLLVFLGGAVCYIGWVLIFMKKRRKIDYMRFQESAANQGNLIEIINGMSEVKLNNAEQYKKRHWQEIQAKLYNINSKGLTLSQTQDIGGVFIDQTKNIIITFIAASYVISGDMTLGMMMAIQFIIGQMNVPLNKIITFLKTTQDTRISLERVNEINMKEDEIIQNENKINKIPVNADIVLSNVTFHYNGKRSPKVIDELSMIIPSKKVTAIVGTSGSGKTTLIKLLLGFYKPTSGSITLSGEKLSEYNMRRWREYCGVVMQDGYIFTDTIDKNVALCDKEPDSKKVKDACETAALNSFIELLPMKFNTEIGPDGMNLSTGQKQRLLIARAVYKNAPYVFLDEATNSLDANNEKVIMHNLVDFYQGRTVVVVAHRLSTVINADNIVVVEKGKIVEQGTHNQLIKRRGSYYRLVKNQLELGG